MSIPRAAPLIGSFLLPTIIYFALQRCIFPPIKPPCRYHLHNAADVETVFQNEWNLFKVEQKKRTAKMSQHKQSKLKIVILMLVERGTELIEYRKAVSTVQCYAQIHNYTMKLAYDTGFDHRCPHQDKFFRRHCISAIILQDYDYLLFLDADTGVINPNKKIEEFIDERYDVLLYDRIWNQEIAAGSYLVKNSNFSSKFLNDFANYENQLDFNSEHGTDNGALHAYIAELLLGKNSETYRLCMDVYRNSKSLEDLFAFEVCIRAALGRWQEFGKIKIYKKGTAWIRDSWATNSLWSPRRDFFLHDWKEHNIQNYTICELPIDITVRWHGKLHYPLIGEIDMDRCVPGNTTWNYDNNLVRSAEDINAELIRREYYIEQERFKRLARIPEILGL